MWLIHIFITLTGLVRRERGNTITEEESDAYSQQVQQWGEQGAAGGDDLPAPLPPVSPRKAFLGTLRGTSTTDLYVSARYIYTHAPARAHYHSYL